MDQEKSKSTFIIVPKHLHTKSILRFTFYPFTHIKCIAESSGQNEVAEAVFGAALKLLFKLEKIYMEA